MVSCGIAIGQVIWTTEWEEMGTAFLNQAPQEQGHIPEWFWNLEESTYNNLRIDNSVEARTNFVNIRPVEGRFMGEVEDDRDTDTDTDISFLELIFRPLPQTDTIRVGRFYRGLNLIQRFTRRLRNNSSVNAIPANTVLVN